MRERSIQKLERDLRGKLLDAATRLLATAEKQASEGRPHLLRTIVAISRSAGTVEASKMRRELTESALELRAAASGLDVTGQPAAAPEIDWSLGDYAMPDPEPPPDEPPVKP